MTRAPQDQAEGSRLAREEKRLIEELPLTAGIFLPTEVVPLEQRVAGLKRVRAIYEWWWKREYAPRLRQLRRRYKGKPRCFIIGNGPSLNHTDLGKLRDEVTFGVNGLFLKFGEMGYAPTFYVVEDHLVAEDRAAAINALEGPLKLFPFNLAYCLNEGPDTLFFNHRPRPNPPDFEFSTDASRVTYTGCTVTFTCMQLAFYLGFAEIYLVGVDASYEIPKTVERTDHYGVSVLDMQGDDPNHFHPDYFGKGYRWHDPQVDKMVAAYQEARRVTEAHGVQIRNATIGGKLEVFERVAYDSLFKPTGLVGTPSPAPSVLILDMTELGSSSATGQIKKTLFSGWPEGRLAQVFAAGHGRFGLWRGGRAPLALDDPGDAEEAVAWCQSFDPDVVYFRPHDHPAYFHDFALEVIDALGVPVVTHLMDDWPARAGRRAGAVFRRLPAVLAESATCFSICEAMSQAFEARYGVPFQAIGNGIEPQAWTALDGERATRDAGDPLVMRYVGGLAEDMGVTSLTDVAGVVDALHGELGLRFEVHTPPGWRPKAETLFARYRGVSVHETGVSEEDYRRILVGCHMLLIAYNFDARSIAYVRYSMANKMPECLASGVPVLAYGPLAVATIAYLAEHGVAEAVTARDPKALESALRRFVADPGHGASLGVKGRAFGFERHPLAAARERLHAGLATAAKRHGYSPGVKPKSAHDPGLLGCYPSRERRTIDEAGLLAELLPAGGTVLTAGAERPEALAPFLKRGCTVQALALDPARPVDLFMGPALAGVPWTGLRPRMALCAFQGAGLHALAGLLASEGYRVWVSEWHPRPRLGSGRYWRRLVSYPCHLGSPAAWGYCIATRDPVDAEALAQSACRAVEGQSPLRSIPWLGLTYQRTLPKLRRWARALFDRTRLGLITYLDGHHSDAAARLRAAVRRIRSLRT